MEGDLAAARQKQTRLGGGMLSWQFGRGLAEAFSFFFLSKNNGVFHGFSRKSHLLLSDSRIRRFGSEPKEFWRVSQLQRIDSVSVVPFLVNVEASEGGFLQYYSMACLTSGSREDPRITSGNSSSDTQRSTHLLQ